MADQTIHETLGCSFHAPTGPEVVAALKTDALANGFVCDAYSNGEADISTRDGHVSVQIHNVAPEVRVYLMSSLEGSLMMTRMEAIKVRNALDVAIKATAKPTKE